MRELSLEAFHTLHSLFLLPLPKLLRQDGATIILLEVPVIPTVTVHRNASFGGSIWSVHETNWFIKYLGNVTSFEACLDACRTWHAQPGAKCKAAEWYMANPSEPLSQGCYARIDGLN